MVKTLMAALFGLVIGIGLFQGDAQAQDKHRLIVHVDDNDPARMNLVLNNISAVAANYLKKGEEIDIEVVTIGPGLNMLIAGKSPVADRVKSVSENFSNISFLACGTTHETMSKKVGKDIPLVPQAKIVPGGLIHIIERDEQGWTYVRP